MKEKRTFASSPLLICLAAAFGICAALPLSASGEVSKLHEKATDRMYADQDKEAARARKLFQDKKYAEAIKILKDNVISMLEEEASRVDGWKVRKRLTEFSGELRAMKLTYGNIKLTEARQKLDAGAYDDAIALANEAALITDEIKDDALAVVVSARGKISAAKRRESASAIKSDPGIDARDLQVKRKLAEAKVFFRDRRYDKAWQKVEEVYVLDPYNADASYLASQIYKKFYQAGRMRHKADSEAQYAYEAWQWVEPVFPVRAIAEQNLEVGESIVKEGNDYAVQKRLDSIVFPMVSFNKTELEAVVQFMRNNKSLDPEKEGVQITFILPNRKAEKKDEQAGDAADAAAGENSDSEDGESEDESDDDDWGDDSEEEKKPAAKEENGVFVTLELRNVTLRQLLDYVCFLTDLTYVIRDGKVFFGAEDQNMESREYVIHNTVKEKIAGQKGEASADAGEDMGEDAGEDAGEDSGEDAGEDSGEDAGEDAGGAAPAAPAAPAVVDESKLDAASLKNFFTVYGLTFPDKSSISYFRGKLVMSNTAENHRKLADLLKRWNVEDPLIEVEIKSIELYESDMEELGFNWALSSEVGNRDQAGRYWAVAPGSNTESDGSGTLKLLDGALSGVDSGFIKNLNIFPDLFGSWTPFGLDETFNLTLTINALDRSDRTEQISAPRVLVANGQTAKVRMSKAYFFPEEWEEMEVETEEVGDNGDIRVTITPPSPTFADQSSSIGTTFTVTPVIQEGKKVIRLNLYPDIKAYTGKDAYDVLVRVERDNNADGDFADENEVKDYRYVVWRPVIATRSVQVTVDVNHGETLVIGGLSDSKSQKRLDKIPILADIPFIGRIFQSQSEISERRNMLIFVTARLVNNDGLPLPMGDEVGNGGIPLMVR
ncbi:MAG: hypothetical protein E7057_04175 [Lentisphaerae bacterium]|nr:hypothetical protein [Lentisphaerota bacterium]